MSRTRDYLLAKAVRSSVFSCLMNAYTDRSREEAWFKQADKLERKFKTQTGVCPYAFIEVYETYQKEKEERELSADRQPETELLSGAVELHSAGLSTEY